MLLRAAVSFLAKIFGAFNPLVCLAFCSVLLGIGMLWVVGKTSNQRAIERAKKRMQACLLEMRLYSDEPRLLFRAQGTLLLNNARYLGHMLRPVLVLGLPMLILFAHFDSVYGHRPLQVGESALFTVNTTLPSQDLTLTASGALEVDSVAVGSAVSRQVFWRLRAVEEGSGQVSLETPHGSVEMAAVVGSGMHYTSSSRSGELWHKFLFSPGEASFSLQSVDRLSIGYPPRSIGFGALETHWVVWFLVISILAAYLLKGRFGVVL